MISLSLLQLQDYPTCPKIMTAGDRRAACTTCADSLAAIKNGLNFRDNTEENRLKGKVFMIKRLRRRRRNRMSQLLERKVVNQSCKYCAYSWCCGSTKIYVCCPSCRRAVLRTGDNRK